MDSEATLLCNFSSTKTQALQAFKDYVAQYCQKLCKLIMGQHTKKKTLKKFCISKEVAREFTVPETPEQNGVAEHFHRTVVESTRGLLIDSKLPKKQLVSSC